MPGKKHKYGIKLYMLAQPDGLVSRLHVYAGGADTEVGGECHTNRVVFHLMKDSIGKGHSLFMDNFYNSVSLTRNLMEKQTFATGTLRTNRLGNPKLAKEKVKKIELKYGAFSEDGICVFRWHDKRDVTFISSEYDATLKELSTRRGQIVTKPEATIQYNKFMGGVDKSDQLLAYYPIERKTLR